MAKYKREKQRSVADRLRWLAPHVEGFKAQLGRDGYSPATITELTRLLACWAEWVRNAGFDIDSVETGFIASAEIFRGGKTARAPQGAARLFVDYLRRKGVLTPEAMTRPRKSGRSWPPSEAGCASSAASPTLRSTPISRR